MAMKLFLSVDMEGISGIVDTSYINPDSGMNYARGRQFMTEDANAVIEAALEWGATEIVVADSHNTMNNILWESLHPEAKLLAGSPRDYSMMQGLDQSFDAAFSSATTHVRASRAYSATRCPGLFATCTSTDRS